MKTREKELFVRRSRFILAAFDGHLHSGEWLRRGEGGRPGTVRLIEARVRRGEKDLPGIVCITGVIKVANGCNVTAIACVLL